MQSLQRQSQVHERIDLRRPIAKTPKFCGKQEKDFTIKITEESKECCIELKEDSVKSENGWMPQENSLLMGTRIEEEDDPLSPEHGDRLRLQEIRSEFYKFNSDFEQILKFKPIRKVNLSKIELNLEKSYEAMTGIQIDQNLLSFDS